MSQLVIPCPKCHSDLKLPNRKLLGRVAKCPKCTHKFRLEEPDEIELELAEPPPAKPTPPAANSPALGTSARWVPDTNDPPPQSPQSAAEPETANPFQFVDSAAAPVVNTVSGKTGRETAKKTTAGKRRKKKKKTWPLIAGGIAVLALIVAAVLVIRNSTAPEPVAAGNPPPVVNEQWQQQQAEMIAASDDLSALSPTSGEPISLLHVPAGTQLLIHLRPAELWQSSNQFTEFRASLGPIAIWIETAINQFTGISAADIKELTLYVVLGSRGSIPETSAVVTLATPRKRIDMVALFDAEHADTIEPVYTNGPRSWVILDETRFVIGPTDYLDDILGAIKFPTPASPGIEGIIQHSDRDRHLTVIFRPEDLAVHAESLAAANVIPAAERFSEWFGNDVESVAWSLHLGDSLFVETLLRNQSQITVPRLQGNMRSRLNKLPNDILDLVRMTNPSQTGHRKLIGRYPAMTKAFSLATKTGFDTRLVRMTTILPERAAPNLALGTLLTWNETTADYFGSEIQVAAAPTKTLPATVKARLQIPLDYAFENTPLEEVVALIGSEIGVTFILDGDALKAAGYTQNLKQTFNLGSAPAIKSLQAITTTKAQEKIAYVVDEAAKTITVMTKAAVADKGLTALTFE